jgi:hypothetical protein
MPAQPTYGELAYRAFDKLLQTGYSPTQFQDLPEVVQVAWENTATAVIAAFHTRQLELARQTEPQWLALARAKFKEAEELCDKYDEYYGFFGQAFQDFIDHANDPPWTQQSSSSPSGPTTPGSSLAPSPHAHSQSLSSPAQAPSPRKQPEPSAD